MPERQHQQHEVRGGSCVVMQASATLPYGFEYDRLISDKIFISLDKITEAKSLDTVVMA